MSVIDELRELPAEDLKVEISKAREKLFKFRFHGKNEEMQRAGEIRALRRRIARVLTIVRERELAAQGRKIGAGAGKHGENQNGDE